MASILDYPIYFGFGAVDGQYYGPNGLLYPYHHGEDRACPVGTPVIVSGNTIALSGNTGISDGPHCHIDKNQSFPGSFGGYVNPSDWPTITGTVHFEGAYGTAGNIVVIRADNGFFYRFLHLSLIKVSVGQRINKQGGDMPLTADTQDRLIKGMLGRDPTAVELNDSNWRNDPNLAIITLWEHGGKQRFADDQKPPVYTQIGVINGEPVYKKN